MSVQGPEDARATGIPEGPIPEGPPPPVRSLRRPLLGATLLTAAGLAFFTGLFGLFHGLETGRPYAGMAALLLGVGAGFGLLLATRACRGFLVDESGVGTVSLFGSERHFSWDEISFLVYCVPRSPDAAEGFWFELASGAKVGIPMRCARAAAGLALARGTPLKIVRFHQPGMVEVLKGKAHRMGELYLKGRLEGKRLRHVLPPRSALDSARRPEEEEPPGSAGSDAAEGGGSEGK